MPVSNIKTALSLSDRQTRKPTTVTLTCMCRRLQHVFIDAHWIVHNPLLEAYGLFSIMPMEKQTITMRLAPSCSSFKGVALPYTFLAGIKILGRSKP